MCKEVRGCDTKIIWIFELWQSLCFQNLVQRWQGYQRKSYLKNRNTRHGGLRQSSIEDWEGSIQLCYPYLIYQLLCIIYNIIISCNVILYISRLDLLLGPGSQNRESTCNQARGRRSIIANYKMNSQLSLYQFIPSDRVNVINQTGKKSTKVWMNPYEKKFCQKVALNYH